MLLQKTMSPHCAPYETEKKTYEKHTTVHHVFIDLLSFEVSFTLIGVFCSTSSPFLNSALPFKQISHGAQTICHWRK